MALQALPPLTLRVHQAPDGECEVRRHGVAVQTVELVVYLLAAAEHVRVHSDFKVQTLISKVSWLEIASYHFHEEEAGGVDGDVGRVLLPAGFPGEAHHDHRRRRQEEELDGQKLDAPFFLKDCSGALLALRALFTRTVP